MLCDPRPLVDVTQRGVTLRYLLELLDNGLVDPSWTIQDAVDKFVRPKTSATRCCLFDVVPLRHTGCPQYFVSHTWSQRYRDLMELLKTHFAAADVVAGHRRDQPAPLRGQGQPARRRRGQPGQKY